MRNEADTAVALFLFLSMVGCISGCGTRLGNGQPAVLCSLGNTIMGRFNESLCTHAHVTGYIECDNTNNICRPKISQESEAMIERLHDHMPLGVYIKVNLEAEDYLKTTKRRSNTVQAIADLMTSKNLSYVQFVEHHWHPTIKKKEKRNYIDLVKDMAKVAHDHKWSVGMQIEITGKAVNAVYDFDVLSEYVDYFVLSVRRAAERVNGKVVLGAAFPLASKANEGGSYTYALDYIRPKIKPECLLMQIEGGGMRFVATEAWVDAGPGSLADPHEKFVRYNEICRRNIDDSCPEYWDESASQPFSVCGAREYFSFENQTSIRLKIDLMRSRQIAGVHFHWTAHDDVDGICGLGKMPQLTAMQGIRTKEDVPAA